MLPGQGVLKRLKLQSHHDRHLRMSTGMKVQPVRPHGPEQIE
jgi:hypothetical protein